MRSFLFWLTTYNSRRKLVIKSKVLFSSFLVLTQLTGPTILGIKLNPHQCLQGTAKSEVGSMCLVSFCAHPHSLFSSPTCLPVAFTYSVHGHLKSFFIDSIRSLPPDFHSRVLSSTQDSSPNHFLRKRSLKYPPLPWVQHNLSKKHVFFPYKKYENMEEYL